MRWRTEGMLVVVGDGVSREEAMHSSNEPLHLGEPHKERREVSPLRRVAAARQVGYAVGGALAEHQFLNKKSQTRSNYAAGGVLTEH